MEKKRTSGLPESGEGAVVSTVACLVSSPLTLNCFNIFSPIALIGNLLIIPDDKALVDILDVGQWQAALIDLPGSEYLMIDTGPAYRGGKCCVTTVLGCKQAQSNFSISS